jgi:hypothetical protein
MLPEATFQTYDTTGYETTGRFSRSTSTGCRRDGLRRPRAEHLLRAWFTEHPNFRNGGLVAIWYEHGTRFLRVAPDGRITEVGWNLPARAGPRGQWVTDRVVYVRTTCAGWTS